MKYSATFQRFSQVLLLGAVLISGAATVGAKEGYSLEVKVTPEAEGEATSVSTEGLALRDNNKVVLPIQLAGNNKPATAQFIFDLSIGAVGVSIEDLLVVSSREGGNFVPREYFDGTLYLKWNEEMVIFKSSSETVSCIVRPPKDEAGEKDGLLSAEELKEIRVKFSTSQTRIYMQIYNATEHQISSFMVHIEAEPVGEFEGVDRRYQWRGSVDPFSDENTQIEADLPELPEGVEYKVTLLEAVRR